jgi:hypothetical protein
LILESALRKGWRISNEQLEADLRRVQAVLDDPEAVIGRGGARSASWPWPVAEMRCVSGF